MNIRDCATDWVLTLQRIRFKLDDMENCEDGCEMIAIAQELSADIEVLEERIDHELELNMDDK